MNRTNEFNHLITSLEIPQSAPPVPAPKTDFSSVFEEINTLLRSLEKQDGYERYVTENKMKKVFELMEKYREATNAFKITPGNENEGVHLRSLKEMLANKHTKMMIRYHRVAKKKEEKVFGDTKRRETFSYSEPVLSQVLLDDKDHAANDMLRKRMVTQMNELGQMVTDISLHVNLQGEEIKRIDELVEGSEGFIKESLYEMNRVWDRVSVRRKRMLKFFAFWIFLALIFWYFRRK